MKFEAEGPRICKFFEIITAINSDSETSVQLLKQNAFLTCSWRFLRSNTLEQLELKLDKNKWDLETNRKRQKIISEEQKAGDVIHHHSSMQKKKCTYVRIKYVCICDLITNGANPL